MSVAESGQATGAVAPRAKKKPFFNGWKSAQIFWCGLSYVFLLAPLIIVIGASFDGGTGGSAISFPPENLTLKWYFEIPGDQFQALGVSIMIATLTAIGSALIGIPAALGLVRSNIRGKYLLAALFRAPMQIPAVVTGLAFLQMYYWFLSLTGVAINGTFAGLMLGHLFIGIPYVIGAVTAVLQRFDGRLEEAALILGAPPLRVLMRVTLPVMLPGIYAGCLYAFMVSFADVPLSIFLTSPGLVTYPVELFFALENDFTPSILASSTLVIIFSLVMLLSVQRLIGLDALLKSGGGSGR
jgi:putative spermidine/putrescine transport system permease protein